MFKVEIIGNIAADAEKKDANGSQFVTFRVADSSKYKKSSGEEVETLNWIDVTLSNADSKVVPYLKRGVKVFVRGNGSLRVYSSKKDRCMKAGLQVNAIEIELCGGNNDAVAREVIDPVDGTIHQTRKLFWCDIHTKGMKRGDTKEILDARGGLYLMDYSGFISPQVQQPEAEEAEEQTESQAQ